MILTLSLQKVLDLWVYLGNLGRTKVRDETLRLLVC